MAETEDNPINDDAFTEGHEEKINQIETFTVSWFRCAMDLMKYVFNSPTFWAHETTSFLIAAIFLIGGPVALARDKHIRVRMIYDSVTPQRKRVLDIVNSVIALIFFAGLTYASWVMVGKSWFTPGGELHLEGTGTSWNPPTPALLKLMVLICVAVMFVQTCFHLIAALRRDTSDDTATDGGQ